MTNAERQRRYRLKAREETNMVDTAIELRPPPPPLPTTRSDLLAGYKLKRKRSINDLVEEIIVKLWDVNEEFMRLVSAVYDSEAIEGSLNEDDTMAAQIIREFAKKEGGSEVASKNLHSIKLAMRVGLRRFGIARPEREEQAQLLLAMNQPPQSQTAE